MICALWYYIAPHYNGTPLYIAQSLSIIRKIKTILSITYYAKNIFQSQFQDNVAATCEDTSLNNCVSTPSYRDKMAANSQMTFSNTTFICELAAKPLSAPTLVYCHVDPWIQWNINWNSNIWIHAFSNATSWMQMLEFQLIFDWTQCSTWQYTSVGADSGLEPIRRQAISEPMMVWFTDAYIRHSSSMVWHQLIVDFLCEFE